MMYAWTVSMVTQLVVMVALDNVSLANVMGTSTLTPSTTAMCECLPFVLFTDHLLQLMALSSYNRCWPHLRSSWTPPQSPRPKHRYVTEFAYQALPSFTCSFLRMYVLIR